MEYLVSGKGGSAKKVAPDNLRSQDQMEVVIGLCEGEIEGFYTASETNDGLDSLMLNDTPFRNLDGSLNFEDAVVLLYKGTVDQGPIQPVLGGLSRSRSVGVTLAYGIPVTRTSMGGTTINYLDIRLIINQLFDNDNYSEGNLTCTFRVEWKLTARSTWQSRKVNVVGKTSSSPFVREVRVPVSPDVSTNNRYDIRVTLLTKSENNFVANATWESFQEVQRYPERNFAHTAILHFWCRSSDQISALPEISGIYKCLRVRVPSNFDPITRTYNGVWDGSFKFAWTDDPAWCLYDLVMNDRYGLNSYGPITLNKWDAYRASKFCNKYVPAMEISDEGLPVEKVVGPFVEEPERFDFYHVVPVSPTGTNRWYFHPLTPAMASFIVQFSEDGTNVKYFAGSEKSVGYRLNTPIDGTYTLSLWGDDAVEVYVDGVNRCEVDLGELDDLGGQKDFSLDLTAGEHVFKFLVVNAGFAADAADNPYALSSALYKPDGSMIWNTRMVETLVSAPICRPGWTYVNDRCEKANSSTKVWEPRFTFNGVISDPRMSMEQVRYMAGAFHGVLYDDLDGTLRLCVPDAQPPTAIFNQSNVENGVFEYSMTDLMTRFNDWTATFVNPNLMWAEDKVRVFDSRLIEKYGRLPNDFVAVACIYESEAIRRVFYRYQIATGQTKLVKFKTNRQSCWVRPYDRIRIADTHADGKHFGRVKAVSADKRTITLHDPVSVTGYYYNKVVPIDYLSFPGTRRIPSEVNNIAVAMSLDGIALDYYTDQYRSVGYKVNLEAGTYTLSVWADDIANVSVDEVFIGQAALHDGDGDHGFTTLSFTIDSDGDHFIAFNVANLTANNDPIANPYAFSAKITGPDSETLWTTRDIDTLYDGCFFIPQTPGDGSKAYRVIKSQSNSTTIRLERPLEGVFPEPNFPFNLIFVDPEREALWRVINIYEEEGSPDKVVIEAVNDWGFDDHEETSESPPEGYTPGPTLDGTFQPGQVPTVETVPPPLSGCPDFGLDWSDDGLNILISPAGLDPDYTRYNGEYRVYSRPAGSTEPWAERSTYGNRILSHPSGSYEFKVLPLNIYGVAADFSSAPTCLFSVPQCPGVDALGTPQNLSTSVTWDGNGGRNAYLVDWDEGGVYVASYQVVVRDRDTGAVYRTADVDAPYFRYTAPMQISDAAPEAAEGFVFEVRYRDYCGTLGNPLSAEGTKPPPDDPTKWPYKSTDVIDYHCATLLHPMLRGYTEHVVNLGSVAGAVTIDITEGNVFALRLVGDAVVSVVGGCGSGRPVTLLIARAAEEAITYADPIRWRNGLAPVMSSDLAMHLLFDAGGDVGWIGAEGAAVFA